MPNSNGTAHLYGRFQTPEPLAALASLHLHDGVTPLREVTHAPPLGVLDQEDLRAQGIRVSDFIPGATDVDALGSCTANAYTGGLAEACLRACNGDASAALALFQRVAIFGSDVAAWSDVVHAERSAIAFYHGCTYQTGQPQQEWPPTDCGSSGPYVTEYAEKLGQIGGQQVASAGQNLVSLLQGGAVLMGSPWFYAWEQPGAAGMLDGNGTPGDLQNAINSGVAGGHETLLIGVAKLAVTEAGAVLPEQTVIEGRNSWSASWGDGGHYRLHLSTLVAIGAQCDFRQLTPVAA